MNSFHLGILVLYIILPGAADTEGREGHVSGARHQISDDAIPFHLAVGLDDTGPIGLIRHDVQVEIKLKFLSDILQQVHAESVAAISPKPVSEDREGE